MTRPELLKNLRSFRDSWKKVTNVHQDLDDVRLKDESDADLRELLKFYYSKGGKLSAERMLK